MIVDDDMDDVDIFIDAAREVESTVNCIGARNGLDAINIIKTTSVHPEYIFVDLNMPKLNGKQFIREIRKDPSFCNTKIIVYSTSKMDSDEIEVKFLGADEFITIPTSLTELCCELARITSREYHNGVMRT
jgi:DNA-binding response OmpR family regulator